MRARACLRVHACTCARVCARAFACVRAFVDVLTTTYDVRAFACVRAFVYVHSRALVHSCACVRFHTVCAYTFKSYSYTCSSAF